jgi:hypothetical protein
MKRMERKRKADARKLEWLEDHFRMEWLEASGGRE